MTLSPRAQDTGYHVAERMCEYMAHTVGIHEIPPNRGYAVPA